MTLTLLTACSIFVCQALELPLVPRNDSSSQSASTASTTTSSPSPQSPVLSTSGMPADPFAVPSPPLPPSNGFGSKQVNHPHANHAHLHRIHYLPRLKQSPPPPQVSPPSSQKSSTKSKSSLVSNEPSIKEEIWVRSENSSGSKSLLSLSDTNKIKSDQGSTTDDNIEIVQDYSYVHFSRSRPSVHEYSYPNLESLSGGGGGGGGQPASQPRPERTSSQTSLKKHNLDLGHPPLPTKPTKTRKERKRDKKQQAHLLSHQRSHCKYCHEYYLTEENYRGACDSAPDRAKKCIDGASCIACAHGMLYHCMSDPDGGYPHPCICDKSDESNCKKWTVLTVLSIFVPCLWCYWPLMACYKCGVACHCCGGKHAPK